MIYLDTSMVVALLTPEPDSERALQWFEGCREPLISSDWLISETHGALVIKQRHHGHCRELASFDGRMHRAAAALGLRPVRL